MSQNVSQATRVNGVELSASAVVGIEFCLLALYFVAMVCLQAFNTVYPLVGASLGDKGSAVLITSIPSLALGIVCFMYSSLADFVSLKRMLACGLGLMLVGSVGGLLEHDQLLLVVLWRTLQVAGGQVAGSLYLVVAARFAPAAQRGLYVGIMTTIYQLAVATGVFVSGLVTSELWYYLFALPLVAVFALPYLLSKLPQNSGTGQVDVAGFGLFGCALGFLTYFFTALSPWMLAIALAAFTAFGIYCVRAQNPFVTPAFFKNKGLMCMLLIIVLLYVPNFVLPRLIVSSAQLGQGIAGSNMAFWLLWANGAGAFAAGISGPLMKRIGRKPLFVLAGSLYGLGLLTSTYTAWASIWLFVASLMALYMGQGMIFTANIETVLLQVDPRESGRALGMNDLCVSVGASLGVTFVGKLLAQTTTASLTPAHAAAANPILHGAWIALAVSVAVAFALYLALEGRVIRRTSSAARR